MNGSNEGKNGRLVPANGQAQVAWALELRNAVYDAMRPADMKEVVEKIVANAKAGDLKAAQFLFDYVLGGKSQTVNQRHIVSGRPPRVKADVLPAATAAKRRKLPVLQARATNEEDLFEEEGP